VTATLQGVLDLVDLVVGTEEEIHLLGGSTNTLDALRSIRTLTDAPVVVKRGAKGCVVFEGVIPGELDEGLVAPAFTVPVANVLGAGDGFMAGFLRGWLRGSRWRGRRRGAMPAARSWWRAMAAPRPCRPGPNSRRSWRPGRAQPGQPGADALGDHPRPGR
jgi:sugar/nucleoside kinase (ribokinase family)